MASKSRGSKSGTKAGSTRNSKTAPLAEDVMTSSAALALVVDSEATAEATAEADALPVTAPEPAPATSAPVTGDLDAPAKPVRRRTRKTTATTEPAAGAEPAAPAADDASAAPARPRSRKSTSKPATKPATKTTAKKSVKAAPTEATPAEGAPAEAAIVEEAPASPVMAELDARPVPGLEFVSPVADAVGGDPQQEAADDARFADALAGAFLYAPEPELDSEPASDRASGEPEQGLDRDDAALPAAEAGEPRASTPEPVVAPAAPARVTTATADLPFIIDVPREVPVVDEAPVDEWVERILNADPRELGSAPRVQTTAGDEWVDQVLEPSKTPIPVRPRPRGQPARPAAARPAPSAAPKSVAKPAPRAAAPAPARGGSGKPAAATAVRWWMALPVILVLVVALFAMRAGGKHAPVPESVLGTWTTAFWLYEHQTLEIKPDTVVATLDETDEGRYPITQVETVDAGRELAVKITYRNDRGEDKEIDFLADKDPTTALRFRSHSGLVWVKAE